MNDERPEQKKATLLERICAIWHAGRSDCRHCEMMIKAVKEELTSQIPSEHEMAGLLSTDKLLENQHPESCVPMAQAVRELIVKAIFEFYRNCENDFRLRKIKSVQNA